MPDEEPPTSPVHAPPDGEERGRKLSDTLRSIAGDSARERISVGDLVAALGDRALAALMVAFALPNVLPMPPGTSGILGAPLVFLATQLMFGRRPWLPRTVADRSMLRTDFATLLDRAGPWLTKAERLLRPRLGILVQPPGEYVVGAVCLILSIILVLPIPLGNILPALSICLLSLGILERDGVWVIAGFALSGASIAVVGGVVFALFMGTYFVFSNIFT
jgi:hypothetical protein